MTLAVLVGEEGLGGVEKVEGGRNRREPRRVRPNTLTFVFLSAQLSYHHMIEGTELDQFGGSIGESALVVKANERI